MRAPRVGPPQYRNRCLNTVTVLALALVSLTGRAEPTEAPAPFEPRNSITESPPAPFNPLEDSMLLELPAALLPQRSPRLAPAARTRLHLQDPSAGEPSLAETAPPAASTWTSPTGAAPGPSAPAPVLSLSGLLLDSGRILLRPFQPEREDLWLWIPTLVATSAALVWDISLYHLIRYRLPDPVLGGSRFSYWGSFLGEGFVDATILAAMGLLGDARAQRTCREGLEALAATAVFSRTLKLIFRLERPSFDPKHKHRFGRLQADSFPSGHAMTAFATAAVLGSEYPQLRPLFYGLATYVGVARVQQSTHWVSDVTVGTAFGLMFGWAAVNLHQAVEIAPSISAKEKGITVQGSF